MNRRNLLGLGVLFPFCFLSKPKDNEIRIGDKIKATFKNESYVGTVVRLDDPSIFQNISKEHYFNYFPNWKNDLLIGYKVDGYSYHFVIPKAGVKKL